MWQLNFFDQPRTVGREELFTKVRRLLELYHTGQLGGTSHEVYPDVGKGTLENYLYFTLAPAINFQRNSESLWRSALRTFNDPETRFVFHPASVATLPENKVQSALCKYKLALQQNKHTYIWTTICRTLHTYYGDDPRELLRSCDNDVVKVIALLNNKKNLFPYLSGPKLSNYWLYILSYFTDVRLVNKREISVIPDLHVIRATQHLGLISPENATPERVAETWKNLLLDTDVAPSDIHAPLWRWSRQGFVPEL